MTIKSFEDLECWKEARKFVKMVYDSINSSERFKKDYRLRDQATSAAVSSMSNIAEGFSRHSNKEFVQFLFISKSSASEVQVSFTSLLIRNTFCKKYFKVSMIKLNWFQNLTQD